VGNHMVSPTSPDDLVVRECLSGSKEAWDVFYRRFVGLVRTVTKRHLPFSWDYGPDVTQDVFLALMSGLKSYDATYPLHRFVSMVAERVCVDRYRAASAQKRQADTEPIDHHDAGPQAGTTIASDVDPPDEQMSRAELLQLLKHAFRGLGQRCRELLKLRYYEELPYKEIVEILGGTENSLTVQLRRCLGELRTGYEEVERRGAKR
jgi:RNA polymerase sigma factor (sigma-70 family)